MKLHQPSLADITIGHDYVPPCKRMSADGEWLQALLLREQSQVIGAAGAMRHVKQHGGPRLDHSLRARAARWFRAALLKRRGPSL